MVYLITIVVFSLVAPGVMLVNSDNDTFAIVTDGCIIPSTSRESELIKELSRPISMEKCQQENILLASNSTHIWILRNVLVDYNIMQENEFYCCYTNFSAYKTLDMIHFGDCVIFKTAIKALHEFVRVECFYLDSEIYSDYFVFTVQKIKANRLVDQSTYNVIVLGMEGISRLNFERMMPKMTKYLRDRGAVQLRGFNKVGDNSFPNLFPLLTGKSFKTCRDTTCVMIWELFKEVGFHTALGSDNAAGVLADYEQRWPALPADYYLQPFMNEASKLLKNPQFMFEHRCLRNRLFYKIMLNYIKGLTQTLKFNRLFGFFWEESVSHDLINTPQLMDEGYLNFVEDLDRDKYLDNTILIFISDHGLRWGKFVQTREGGLEARLPLVTILFPTSFRKTYNYAYNNFKINSNRLTTPYDMYWTLVDLVNPTTLTKRKIRRRMRTGNSAENHTSLFLPVSGSRTCAGLGIPAMWCACSAGATELASARDASAAARVLVAYVNQLLRTYSRCRKLHIEEVVAVMESKDAKGSGRTFTTMVRTAPGGALLEGLVRHERAAWAAAGHVARLNSYRNQSHCVDSQTIKLYCFCSS